MPGEAIIAGVLGSLLQRALPNVAGALGLGPPPEVDKEALRRIKPVLEGAINAGHTDVISQNRENLKQMGLSDAEINIYDSAAKGFKPKSPEELKGVIGTIMQGLQPGQVGAPAPTVRGGAPQMVQPTQVGPLVQGTQPEGARTTPFSLYGGEGEQAPTLSPETQMAPQALPSPSAFQLPRLPSEQQQGQTENQNPPYQQFAQAPPQAQQEAPPLPGVPPRPSPTSYGVSDVEITPQGQIKGVKIGKMSATEREAETAQEINRLMSKENMSLRDAMENARGRGFTMDNAAWTQFGQRAFRQTFNRRFNELGGKPTDRLLAAVLAEQEVGSEYADETQRRTLNELRDNPASDPQIGNMVSKIVELVGNGAMKETDAEAAVMRITGGKSLEKLGIRLPGARERVYAQQTPERQAQLLEPPVIVQTPQGPQAVRPTTGQASPLPKPPLPDKILDAYGAANTVITILDDLTNKYDAMVRATGNKLSGKLRQSLAANARYQTLNNFTGITGTTPEENEFAGAYNALMGQLKKFNNVPGSFSDREAVFALQTIGNAARGYGNFHAQQRATKNNAAVSFNQTLNAALAGGRYDAGNVRAIDPNLGQSANVGGVEGVWAGDWAEAAQIAPPKGFKPGWVTREQFRGMPR